MLNVNAQICGASFPTKKENKQLKREINSFEIWLYR